MILTSLSLFRYFFYLGCGILSIILLLPAPSCASVIRDAEVEASLREIVNPIFKAANLSSNSIELYIVNDDEINAYVAGGQNIFINTGLLRLSEDPEMLMGVVAHETGHISGGHLIRGQNEYQSTALKSTVGFLLGLAATAAGSTDAGQAIIAGTSHIADRELLKHTRVQEESADQAALTYLDKLGYSSQGLLDLLDILYRKENTLYDKRNPYTLTHPLSSERIDYIRAHLQANPNTHPIPNPIRDRYKFAVVKLIAFLDDPNTVLAKYPLTDQSPYARYARAIAYYRIPNLQKALGEIDTLISTYPTNPYYIELKGQILLENGHVLDAIPYYEKAKALLPQAALVKIELAGAYLATENERYANAAIDNLEQALPKEKDNAFTWHQLAVAYGRSGQLGMSNLALAEEALLQQDIKTAEEFLKRAEPYITAKSPAAIRRQDILTAISRAKEKKSRLR